MVYSFVYPIERPSTRQLPHPDVAIAHRMVVILEADFDAVLAAAGVNCMMNQ